MLQMGRCGGLHRGLQHVRMGQRVCHSNAKMSACWPCGLSPALLQRVRLAHRNQTAEPTRLFLLHAAAAGPQAAPSTAASTVFVSPATTLASGSPEKPELQAAEEGRASQSGQR